MISNLFVPYLELQWVNSYDTHYAYVDGQSSQSSPAFYTPAYYLLSRIILPHFLSAFYPLSLPHPALPHSRFLPIAALHAIYTTGSAFSESTDRRACTHFSDY